MDAVGSCDWYQSRLSTCIISLLVLRASEDRGRQCDYSKNCQR